MNPKEREFYEWLKDANARLGNNKNTTNPERRVPVGRVSL